MDDTLTFGAWLSDMMRASGYSHAETGRRIGVSRQAVHQWATGASKPTVSRYQDLIDLFGVPPRGQPAVWRLYLEAHSGDGAPRPAGDGADL